MNNGHALYSVFYGSDEKWLFGGYFHSLDAAVRDVHRVYDEYQSHVHNIPLLEGFTWEVRLYDDCEHRELVLYRVQCALAKMQRPLFQEVT